MIRVSLNAKRGDATVIEDVFKSAIDILEQGGQAAMSTIIASKGSLPMSEKSKMLVTPEGQIIGTVGGGCLEADVWTEARRVMEQGKSSIQKFVLTEKYAGESGLNCGGIVEILTEPLPEQGGDIFRAILDLKDTGHRGTLVTVLTDHPRFPEGQRKLLLGDDGHTVGSLGDAALEAFVAKKGQKVLLGEQFAILDYEFEEAPPIKLFMEPVLPTPTVYVFGGGHVSFFVVRAAKLAGFKVKVIDDRPAFANKERFPEADDTIVMEFDQVKDAFDFGQDDYVILVTRGHQHDQHILEQIHDHQARYVGMIGSKSKISKMWKRLEARGVDRKYLDQVHAPIGLNIGADTPEEIAISVVAELIRERREGKVQTTQRKRSHDRRREAAPIAS
jgi:xanthine dehydrogenase accessory factor